MVELCVPVCSVFTLWLYPRQQGNPKFGSMSEKMDILETKLPHFLLSYSALIGVKEFFFSEVKLLFGGFREGKKGENVTE